jgi:SAM-dependent methyltransferase
MGFYDDPESVNEYEKMCEGYDGTQIFAALARHLVPGKTILEVGCGPGNDIESLKRDYSITGSDTSEEFLRRCRIRHPGTEFLNLDVSSLETDRQFDCIYSNKVLHHLPLENLIRTFKRQTHVIAPGGLFAHTFWIGDEEFEKAGMYFRFHDRDALIRLIGEYFEVVELLDYKEFADGDSLFVIAKNGHAMGETTVM